MDVNKAIVPVTHRVLSINSALIMNAMNDYALVDNYIPQAERDKMSEEDFADPVDRKYPIKDQVHLEAACKLLGRAPMEKQASIKKRIKIIAKRKGLALPESWKGED